MDRAVTGGLLASTIFVSPALAANPPTITYSSTVGTPNWTTAKAFDDFQSDTVNGRPISLASSHTTLLFGNYGIVRQGASLIDASATNNYLESTLPDSSPTVFTFTDSGGPYATRTLSFSFSLDSSVDFRLYFQNSDGQSSIVTRNSLFSGITGPITGQITINQDATSYLSSVALFGRAGTILVDNFATAAPEPATWAMMIAGFGFVGTALRRRQKVALRVSYAM